MNPGSIVRCRNRDWVLLPSDSADVHLLRPLTGATDEVVAIHRRLSDLIAYSLPEERLRPASFPLPTADDLSDAAGAHLLWQAARLTLRDGATPFHSLGKISIRPRTYQFVPLLMALRLDPVRLLIADDVGVGKTIEALLIARELLDRGEIKRMCVLCPPNLCEQWQKELAEKLNLDSVVIRSGTVGQLERNKPSPASIYQYYPVQVASIDFLKTDRNRAQFLLDCPEFVIVDEAHGAAASSDKNQGQQKRHQLVREIAKNENRHLILVSATPHSGVEAAFRSLLSLLRDEFAGWDTSSLGEEQRIDLARHFVQRTRRDIEQGWEGGRCFPTREPTDATYRLSGDYQDLFNATHDFCSEIVRTGQSLDGRRRRTRYWGALALLRCVMSSPAAAVAALAARHDALSTGEDEADFRPFIFESSDDRTDDEQPVPAVETAEAILEQPDRLRLRDLGKLAAKLLDSPGDTKLVECAGLVSKLLRDGFHPIVWCRYIATADHVAAGLQKAIERTIPRVKVVSITSQTGDEAVRAAKLDELARHASRVLVATDCLSEGINLQDAYNAVLHYDLPWNPNRLEQREGRVDRYGQRAPLVKAIRYFSPDSAVDGVVLDVLLNKAREIHRTLGTHVPVPEESETVTEALLNALFLRGRQDRPSQDVQMRLGFGLPEVESFHRQWDRDAEREKTNRTRFAQRAIKPEEVARELDATDAVLGDPAAVREFVQSAAQRLGLALAKDRRADVFKIGVEPQATMTLPSAVKAALPTGGPTHWIITFTAPTPEGAEYLGRNHPFVAAVARFLLEEALTKAGSAAASRCGAIRTRAVARLTSIFLLRVRYLLEQPGRQPLLSEEVMTAGVTTSGETGKPDWLAGDEALRLLGEARPDANIPMDEKRELVESALSDWPAWEKALNRQVKDRAKELERSHKRVRKAVSLKVRDLSVEPQLPPDLLGILVLQPLV
jgi:superfamily II DNA or RNA helicase